MKKILLSFIIFFASITSGFTIFCFVAHHLVVKKTKIIDQEITSLTEKFLLSEVFFQRFEHHYSQDIQDCNFILERYQNIIKDIKKEKLGELATYNKITNFEGRKNCYLNFNKTIKRVSSSSLLRYDEKNKILKSLRSFMHDREWKQTEFLENIEKDEENEENEEKIVQFKKKMLNYHTIQKMLHSFSLDRESESRKFELLNKNKKDKNSTKLLEEYEKFQDSLEFTFLFVKDFNNFFYAFENQKLKKFFKELKKPFESENKDQSKLINEIKTVHLLVQKKDVHNYNYLEFLKLAVQDYLDLLDSIDIVIDLVRKYSHKDVFKDTYEGYSSDNLEAKKNFLNLCLAKLEQIK